jgi:hypothetical protein
MQPLPSCARKATELLGQGGELVVLPKTHRGVMEKVARFGFRPDVVASILATGQAVITGSFLLHHLMIGAKWTPGDLDIFGSQAALDVAKFWMWKPDKTSNQSTGYTHMGTKLNNHITQIVEWTSDTGKKLQFVCVKGDVEDAIRGFDLPIVQSWFDGLFVFVPRATHEALQSRACALRIDADMDLNGRAYTDSSTVLKRLGRALKYAARGFAIQLPKYITVHSLCIWDDLIAGTRTNDDDGRKMRALIQWAYVVPKAARRAAAQRRTLAATRRRTEPLPLTEPRCTAVRRKGKNWLTRADVSDWIVC